MARLLTGLGRQQERKEQQRLQARIGNAAAPEYAKEIKRFSNSVASSFNGQTSAAAFESEVIEHQKRLGKILESSWKRAAISGGERVITEAKSVHGSKFERKQKIEDNFIDFVITFIQSVGAAKVQMMSETGIQAIRRQIELGIAESLTTDQIASNIRSKGVSMSAYRSMMIARTETHAAFNFGSNAAAKTSELDLAKEWISASDERTRDGTSGRYDHERADGEIVTLADSFIRTGQPLEYPGDPSGSAGNIIHCRCAKGDVLL